MFGERRKKKTCSKAPGLERKSAKDGPSNQKHLPEQHANNDPQEDKINEPDAKYESVIIRILPRPFKILLPTKIEVVIEHQNQLFFNPYNGTGHQQQNEEHERFDHELLDVGETVNSFSPREP